MQGLTLHRHVVPSSLSGARVLTASVRSTFYFLITLQPGSRNGEGHLYEILNFLNGEQTQIGAAR